METTDDDDKPSEWATQALKVLIPTPGYIKSYTELEAELIAGGVSVPPGMAMLARAERDENGKLLGVTEH